MLLCTYLHLCCAIIKAGWYMLQCLATIKAGYLMLPQELDGKRYRQGMTQQGVPKIIARSVVLKAFYDALPK